MVWVVLKVMGLCMLGILDKGGILNPQLIREEIKKNLNRKVNIVVYGLRNKKCSYKGILNKIYPNIFTIISLDGEKSFSYADIITGDIKIKYE